jgi:Mg2+/Co2+ transporter CorB
MTFTNKILVFLGFCPSKESAQRFSVKNNSLTTNANKWKSKDLFTPLGVLLIFAGLMPFYLEDSSITGVTDTIILHGRLGLASFILGVILIIFGAIIPKIIIKLGNEDV